VVLDDLLDDRQAEAGALGFAGEEGLEDVLRLVGGDGQAGAVVGDDGPHAVAFAGEADDHAGLAGGCGLSAVRGITCEIADRRVASASRRSPRGLGGPRRPGERLAGVAQQVHEGLAQLAGVAEDPGGLEVADDATPAAASSLAMKSRRLWSSAARSRGTRSGFLRRTNPR
jgi:hypothetical protein